MPAVFALAMSCALLLLNATGASATKYYDSTIGTQSASSTGVPPTPASTAFGATFGSGNGGVGDIAVNDPAITTDGTAQSGWTYVIDRGNNRIQAFNAVGAFQWAVGRDVVAPSVSEAQVLNVNATAGKLKLELDSLSTEVDWNITAANLDTAIGTLVGGAANVVVTGTPANGTTIPIGRYAIQFAGTKANLPQNQIAVQPAVTPLTGTASVQTIADGIATPGAGDTSEKQSVTIGVAPTGGSFTLTFGANTTAAIAFNSSAAEVDSALEAIASVGAGNVEVTGAAGGPYAVEFTGTKRSIDQAQMTANAAGLTPSGTVTVATTQDGASFEKCTVTGQCKVGVTTAPANAALGNGGTLNIATGIAIDQATGHFFVGERSTNARVGEFTATGAFVRAFGWDVVASGPGDDTVAPVNQFETCNAAAGDVCKAGVAGRSIEQANPGQFATSTTNVNGITVGLPGAPNAGQVYAVDPSNARIQRFTIPAGIAAAVTPGLPFGKPGRNETFGFGSFVPPETDEELGEFEGSTGPRDLATDAKGVVYISAPTQSTPTKLKRYDTVAGKFLPQVGMAEVAPPATSLSSIEIDPSSGHLLVSPGSSGSIKEIEVSDNPSVIDESDLVDTAGEGININPTGIGVGGGRYFFSTVAAIANTGAGQRLLVFDDSGIDPPATVNLLPPSNVAGTTATLNATINPNGPTGFPTSYRFQVSKNGVDWTDVAPNALVGANGDGSSQVSISNQATGLEGNTLYRLRVITTRSPAAGSTVSNELTLLTDRLKPEVITFSPQNRGATTATLTGAIRTHALATSYHFEWGKTTGYERGRAPVPDAEISASTTGRTVAQDIAGLFPSLTFHYRLVATNAEGTTFGNDMTFQTRSSLPTPSTRSYEMVTPPFKATRAVVSSGPVGANPNIAVASLDGETVAWGTNVFPLTDDVEGSYAGDKRLLKRTSGGWTSQTLNTLPLLPQYSPFFGNWIGSAASADLRTIVWGIGLGDGESMPSLHTNPRRFNRTYTYHQGTGEGGFTQWMSNLDRETAAVGIELPSEGGNDGTSNLTDDGSAMARSGYYRGLAAVHADPGDSGRATTDPDVFDPSLTQQFYGLAGGRTAYVVRADSAADLPLERRELATGCTGTFADATRIPMRNDNGTPATATDDFLDSQPCADAPDGSHAAAGLGDLSSGSNMVTGVTTSSGAFAIGQVLSGVGLRPGTIITAIGAGTLTLSQNATPRETFTATTTNGSPLITGIESKNRLIVAGETVAGVGIPAGTTIASMPNNASAVLSMPTTASGAGVTLSLGLPQPATALTADALQVTSARGAVVAGSGPQATALADDGDRLFFQSPDPDAAVAPTSCATSGGTPVLPSTGHLTDCPSQLYVRQYDSSEAPTLRWVSQPTGFGSGAPAAGLGTLTAGSNSVTAVTTTTGAFTAGQTVRGNGIPAGTTISAAGAGTLTLSQNASASGALTVLAAGSQQIGQLAPVVFQGASRSGRFVYFKTTTPLLPSDPNGGLSSSIGTASSSISNDLYRYELPSDHDDDPAGGTLTRISAGPAAVAVGSGTLTSASPTVTGLSVSSGSFVVGQSINAGGIPGGTTVTAVSGETLTLSANATASGARTLSAAADPNPSDVRPLRFLSDDGERAYFNTAAPIPGADDTAPVGGITTPTGGVSQSSTRNLYAFDGTAEGPDRYRFIAALPRSSGPNLNSCATSSVLLGGSMHIALLSGPKAVDVNCFRGTPSGNAVIFFTTAKLTADDDVSSGDIYLYDIRTDELTRITAQPGTVDQSEGYRCHTVNTSTFELCHGQTGIFRSFSEIAGSELTRGWSGIKSENIVEEPDGSVSVYFESPLQFVPEDTNSAGKSCDAFAVKCQFWDVYQWRGGSYSLISPGNSEDNSWFSGNSLDGRDVFFLTSARIDPREIDDYDFDIYDARVGGGFPYTPPAIPCDVLAHQCRGVISAQQQPDAGVVSSSAGASENVAPAKKKSIKKKTKKKAKKKTKKSKRSSTNGSSK